MIWWITFSNATAYLAQSPIHLSVTRVDPSKTKLRSCNFYHMVALSHLSIFWGVNFHREILKGSPCAGASNKGGVGKKAIKVWPYIWYIIFSNNIRMVRIYYFAVRWLHYMTTFVVDLCSYSLLVYLVLHTKKLVRENHPVCLEMLRKSQGKWILQSSRNHVKAIETPLDFGSTKRKNNE